MEPSSVKGSSFISDEDKLCVIKISNNSMAKSNSSAADMQNDPDYQAWVRQTKYSTDYGNAEYLFEYYGS